MENTYKKIAEKEFKKQITEFKSPVKIHFFVKCTQFNPAQWLAVLQGQPMAAGDNVQCAG